MESECSAYFTSKRGVPSASEKAWILSSPLRILENTQGSHLYGALMRLFRWEALNSFSLSIEF
jgi:hypothetical protein